VAYDGNGNVVALVCGTDGGTAAQYDYSPFGETLLAVVEPNSYRNSTRYSDGELGLVYYGFRYLVPCFGRWTARDPMGEDGGENLQAFITNGPFDALDLLGLERLSLDFMTSNKDSKGDELPDEVQFSLRNWIQEGFPERFTSFDDLLQRAARNVGTCVDPAGLNGNCIGDLTITAHSGTGGLLMFSSDQGANAESVFNGNLSPGLDQKLRQLRGLLCKDARVVLNQCSGGAGAEGTRSLQALAAILGVPVTAPTTLTPTLYGLGEQKTAYPDGRVVTTPGGAISNVITRIGFKKAARWRR
jgi:RHS repeat-associated protein